MIMLYAYSVQLALFLPADQIQWSYKQQEQRQNLQDFHMLNEETWDETMHWELPHMKYQKQTMDSQCLLLYALCLRIPER